jgi:hypothetical protein
MPPSGILAAEDQPFSGKPGVHAPAGQPLMLNVAEHAGQLEQVRHRPNPRTIDNRASQSCRGVRDKPVRSCTRLRIARMADSPAHGGISPSHACTQLRKPTGAARPRRGNGRFRCTGMTGGPAKIIAGGNGCMNLCRTRVLPTLAAATFRMGLIMERGFMRHRIGPGSDYAGPRRWDGR